MEVNNSNDTEGREILPFCYIAAFEKSILENIADTYIYSRNGTYFEALNTERIHDD